MDSITGAIWSWRDDKKWIEYSPKLILFIENEYRKGTKRIKVDDERFIDVSLTKKLMKSTLYCVDIEHKDSIGLQRRFDDESKRRAVKRTAKNFFKSTKFLLYLDDNEYEIAKHIITTHKGSISDSMSMSVDLVVANKVTLSTIDSDQMKLIKDSNIPVVDTNWIIECISHNQYLDDKSKFLIDLKNEDMQIDEQIAEPKIPHMPLKVGSKWEGFCQYPGDDTIYTFTLEIVKIENLDVHGTVLWTSLQNSQTKFKGKVEDDTFQFQEYEIIIGEEYVSIPSSYEVKLMGNRFEGDLKEESSGINGRIEATYKEISLSPSNFKLNITKRIENEIEGELVYAPNFKHNFKGAITSDTIKFTAKIGDEENVYEGKIEVEDDLNPKFCIKGNINNNPDRTFVVHL